MNLDSVAPRKLGLYVGIGALSLALGYLYVLAMGSGYRLVLVINGGVIFFALAAIFLKEIRPFLFTLLLISIPMGLGRHFIYEPITGSTPFAIGINIMSTDVFMFLLYSIWIIDRAGKHRDQPKITLGSPIGSMMLMWIVFMFVVSVSVSKMPNHSLYQVYAAFKGFFIFFLIANTIQTERDLKITYYALVATTLNQAIYLILQWITKTSFTTHGEESLYLVEREGFRSRGFYGAPDTHAILMMLVFNCIFAYFLITKSRSSRMWALISIMTILVGTICTKARIGLGVCVLGSMITIALVYARGYISTRKVTFVLVQGIFAIVLIAPVVAERFITGGYMEDRLPLMYTALQVLFGNFFLGIGPNNYHARLVEFVPAELRTEWAYTVHNEYLLHGAETGIIGVILYYGPVIVAGINFWRLSRSKNQWIAVLSIGMFAALLASVVHRVISIYFVQPVYFMQCFILGLSVALTRVENALNPKPVESGATRDTFHPGPVGFAPQHARGATAKAWQP